MTTDEPFWGGDILQATKFMSDTISFMAFSSYSLLQNFKSSFYMQCMDITKKKTNRLGRGGFELCSHSPGCTSKNPQKNCSSHT